MEKKSEQDKAQLKGKTSQKNEKMTRKNTGEALNSVCIQEIALAEEETKKNPHISQNNDENFGKSELELLNLIAEIIVEIILEEEENEEEL